MKLKTLDTDCSEKLNNRLADEFKAFYFYKNAANFCKLNAYEGGYKFFSDEAESELRHAKKIEEYLSEWNVMPSLNPIETPEAINSYVDIFEKAYNLEYALYEAYNKDSIEILDEDAATFTFIQQFLKIQTDSVFEYNTFLTKLKRLDGDELGITYFDKELLNNS